MARNNLFRVQLQDGDQISVGGMKLHFHQIGNPGDTDAAEDNTVMSSRIVTIASQDYQGAIDNKPEEKLRAVLSISRKLAKIGNRPRLFVSYPIFLFKFVTESTFSLPKSPSD